MVTGFKFQYPFLKIQFLLKKPSATAIAESVTELTAQVINVPGEY